MKRAIDVLQCGLLLAAIALLCAATWTVIDLRKAAITLEPKAAAALDAVKTIEKSTSDLEEATYATEGEIANLADTMNGIAKGLSDHEAAQLQAAQDASHKLGLLLDHADADVQALGGTARAATAAIDGMAGDSHIAFGEVHEAVSAAHAALEAAAADLSDAAIHQTFLHIAATSLSLDAMAADGRAFIHRETAPARGAWNTAKGVAKAVWVLRGAAGF